jgi:tetratricopeptide (TPR) repeat protein
MLMQRTSDTIAGAVREYEKAISLDPDYALAHAALANALMRQSFERGHQNLSEAISIAAPHAERAMDLDPSLAEAHVATGNVLWLQGNPEETLTHMRHAIRINPNYSDAYFTIGELLVLSLGRYKEGFAMHEVSLRLDPLSRVARAAVVNALINRNRMAEADREIEKFSTLAPFYYARWRGRRMSVGGKWANWVLGGLDALAINPKDFSTRRRLSWQFAAIGLEKEARAIADHPHFRVGTYLGRPGDAVTIAEALLELSPLSSARRQIFGMTLAGAGDYERARPILEETWQQSGGRVQESTGFWNTSAVALIAARQATGDEDDIGELLAAIRDNIRRFREAGIVRSSSANTIVDYEEGLAAYLAGERERGLALIAKGVDDGQFIPPNEAYLRVLYDDPGFAPILAKQVARQARERDKLLSIVCTDNPYAAFWQPAEGTCERFATVDAI